MKIILEAKEAPDLLPIDAARASDLGERLAHVMREGVPYCAINLVNAIGGELEARTALHYLIGQERVRYYPWGLYALMELPRPQSVTLRHLLDATIGPLVTCTTGGMAEWVRTVTGEEPSAGALRKCLSRLVKDGVFQRIDSGKYQKIRSAVL
ncbi:hypothetical protein [uncultured Halomonas sp.]|uniref:hypothetical protein n=1 Tax=uncultured Halomonas sp. TaxID=173971 RepID=UPI002603D74F|nr:hypothetical protein [uncultured Halomonas sp.]